jgi:hypothetical protein
MGRNHPLTFGQEHQWVDIELDNGRRVLLCHARNRQDDISSGVQIGRWSPSETAKERCTLQLTQCVQHPLSGGRQQE